MHSQAATAARPATARWGSRQCLRGPRARKLGIVMGQHNDIIAIYRRHQYHRAFAGPAATHGCSCVVQTKHSVRQMVCLTVCCIKHV